MRADRAVAELRGAAAALTFLSRLPFLRPGRAHAEDVARGAWAFPAVGAALGGAVAVAAAAASELLDPAAAAALATALGVLLTGALHLDGLADTADGLGGATRQRALEIMRDNAVGAYGAAAVSLDLLLRFALLAALLEQAGAVAALISAGAVSRAAVLPPARALPYAQPSAGPGAALETMTGGRAAVGVAIGALIAVVAVGTRAVVLLLVAAAVIAFATRFFRRRLGGISGDALGGTIELVELATLTALLALA